MNIAESIRMALRSLAANKLRSALTMLGIVIGTGAVIALLSVGQGAQAEITSQIQSIGSNLIFVFPGQFEQSGSNRPSFQDAEPLTREDAEAIGDPAQAPHVAAVAPQIQRNVTVVYNGITLNTNLIGTTPDFGYVRSFPVAFGGYFTEGEDAAYARVTVLGYGVAEDLFGDPILSLDESIRINGVPFRVIGVLESKGGQSGFGGSQDDQLLVPISTAQRRLFSGRFLSQRGETVDLISVSAIDEDSIDQAMDEITWLLRQRHGIQFEEDDFTVASQEDILGVFNQITSILTIFLGAIAGISLLVGGIGIMNIMLVSVTERTREIGIRKAVGAKRRDILYQFLIEAVALSIMGGLIGIAFGWGIASFVNTLDAFRTVVSAQAVALSVGFSLAVGLFFGIYPANRASNLDPIQALRYE
jgi:putative ABC transport system permease protein